MKDLTDLEICKRINEIEGLSIRKAAHYEKVMNGAGICIGFNPHNPLEDDALCFKLMVKHGITFSYEAGIRDTIYAAAHMNAKSHQYVFDAHPNKAICLAIIETNGE